jgi:hypothetical protein
MRKPTGLMKGQQRGKSDVRGYLPYIIPLMCVCVFKMWNSSAQFSVL